MPLHQKLGLSARLSQRLILTPSLQQAIKLLPLTTLELAEVLEQEVMENPLLEEVPVEETKQEETSTEEPAEREKAEEAADPGGGEGRLRTGRPPARTAHRSGQRARLPAACSPSQRRAGPACGPPVGCPSETLP